MLYILIDKFAPSCVDRYFQTNYDIDDGRPWVDGAYLAIRDNGQVFVKNKLCSIPTKSFDFIAVHQVVG